VEPQTQFVTVPKRTLKNAADLEKWLVEVKQVIADALHIGPVSIG